MLTSSTSAKDLTLATANIINTKRWAVDITTKYTSASLVTLSRMLDLFIPLRVEMAGFVCTMIDTKTTMSIGRKGGSIQGMWG